MNEMVKRVSRVLAFVHGTKITGPGRHRASDEFGWRPGNPQMDEYADKHSHEHVTAAQFAISVLREPTDAMIERAMAPYTHEIDDKMRQAFRETIRGYWHAMIDEALKE